MLRQDGVHTLQNSVTRALGYRQTFGWLQRITESRSANASDVRQLVHDIAGPSRRLHKAQLTFHRDLEHFDWVDARKGASAAAAHIEAHFVAEAHQGAIRHELLQCGCAQMHAPHLTCMCTPPLHCRTGSESQVHACNALQSCKAIIVSIRVCDHVRTMRPVHWGCCCSVPLHAGALRLRAYSHPDDPNF